SIQAVASAQPEGRPWRDSWRGRRLPVILQWRVPILPGVPAVLPLGFFLSPIPLSERHTPSQVRILWPETGSPRYGPAASADLVSECLHRQDFRSAARRRDSQLLRDCEGARNDPGPARNTCLHSNVSGTHNRQRQIAYHGSMAQDHSPRRIVSLQPSATAILA